MRALARRHSRQRPGRRSDSAAGTLHGGIFRSTDNGASWRPPLLPNSSITGLIGTPGVLLAGVYQAGIFRSPIRRLENPNSAWIRTNGRQGFCVCLNGELPHRQLRCRRLPVDRQRRKLDTDGYRWGGSQFVVSPDGSESCMQRRPGGSACRPIPGRPGAEPGPQAVQSLAVPFRILPGRKISSLQRGTGCFAPPMTVQAGLPQIRA